MHRSGFSSEGVLLLDGRFLNAHQVGY
jgi:hypothetical protein